MKDGIEIGINSKEYWDKRFVENWEDFNGPRQSRFFAQTAISNLPSWLIDAMRRESLTFVDWGCAQGDGLDVWASYINPSLLCGVDFSMTAIQKAKIRYPLLKFFNSNWLDRNEKNEIYDVVYSSNTLEHFFNPCEILRNLSARANKAIVLVLPYREIDRIDEHFYTFLPNNIPIHLENGFCLVWSRVIECSKLPNTQWVGHQIFLVYIDPAWAASLKLTLNDCEIEREDKKFLLNDFRQSIAERETEVARLNQTAAEREAQIAHLNQAVAEREAEVARLNQTAAERETQIAHLNQAVAEREAEIDSLNRSVIECDSEVKEFLSSTSWRLTRPLRFMKKFYGSVFSSEQRYAFLKSIYWRLPERIRNKLNRHRYSYVSRRLRRELSSSQKSIINAAAQTDRAAWVDAANESKKIVIIPCAFEFEELVNQRPINAAKYYSKNGYLVLFVAWQWSPNELLSKGCGEVFHNIIQVPLFEFVANSNELSANFESAHFLITMPEQKLVRLVDFLRKRGFVIIYDIMDEWEAFHRVGQAPWFEESTERSLVLQADFVCAVSPPLREKFSDIRSDITVIGNGYSAETLGVEARNIAGSQNNEKKIVGYFGHLTDAWFDWPTLFFLAKERADIVFEVVGYGEPDWVRKKAAAAPNVSLLGKMLPSDLHKKVSSWSAGMIPFVEGELSEAVDPIKIYEYLYFGLPVIVTGIRHLDRFPMTYFSEKETIAHSLDLALNESRSPSDLESFLAQTTWQARFDTLMAKVTSRQGIWSLYQSF
ncbi:methyltransferase domain-containing protein [Allochromatium vinosum]|uniref:Methyltransferase type 12 n=1 Tax=Allochromatium vinosum (strain ATCC 17899 / DSM 180 / NBRC 103801 / NCIMB 10441 / D) TaxID=572477 RepID=D3RVQ1_ALLVD|nr:methyltransferase domain-containing protein [Allochromatium vinosum]ADC63064.1 methyltransferase type 12 [Allochromatium vinosum DSM 180]MBK1654953.1 hypothetical protein [Allochromatium vinosum]